MRILHFIYDHIKNPWVGGGGAVRALEINRRLAEKHVVTIVCGKYPGAEDYTEKNLTTHFVGTNRNNYVISTLLYLIRARQFIRKHRFETDIIVEDFSPYNPLFSFLSMENAVIQLHQSEGFQHLKKYFILGIPFLIAEKIYPKFFKNAITINETGKTRFNPRKNVEIISNGFDPMLIKQTVSEKDYILFLGRLHINQKGLDTLLASLKFTNARLLIAGSGKDHAKVLKMFKDYINSGIVKVVGFVRGREKAELLRNCNFLVMPSRYEGQPITLIEAAACQKPIVVSKISELKFAVDEGFGVSFETNNPEDLGEKINFLLKNERVRKEMGQKARVYAQYYTWDNIADKYEKFLIEMKEAS